MPKKAKIAQNKNQKAPKSNAAATVRKSPPGGKRKAVAKTPAAKKSRPAPTREPSDEEIRTLAYFISERRHRLALAGDASADWLEAKRQLSASYERR